MTGAIRLELTNHITASRWDQLTDAETLAAIWVVSLQAYASPVEAASCPPWIASMPRITRHRNSRRYPHSDSIWPICSAVSVSRTSGRLEPLVIGCWRTRPEESERRIHPITSGGLERRMEPIGRWLEPRAHLLTNKARLDRMLMLMRRQLDGLADEAAYARAVCD